MRRSLKKKIESKKSQRSLKPFMARFSHEELIALKLFAAKIEISMNSLVRIAVADMIEKSK